MYVCVEDESVLNVKPPPYPPLYQEFIIVMVSVFKEFIIYGFCLSFFFFSLVVSSLSLSQGNLKHYFFALDLYTHSWMSCG